MASGRGCPARTPTPAGYNGGFGAARGSRGEKIGLQRPTHGGSGVYSNRLGTQNGKPNKGRIHFWITNLESTTNSNGSLTRRCRRRPKVGGA